jgi:hypothetical protein
MRAFLEDDMNRTVPLAALGIALAAACATSAFADGDRWGRGRDRGHPSGQTSPQQSQGPTGQSGSGRSNRGSSAGTGQATTQADRGGDRSGGGRWNRGSSPGPTGQTPTQTDRGGDRSGGGRWNRGSSPGSTGQTPSQADRSGDRSGGGRWNRGSSPGSTGQTPSQADRSGDRSGGGRWNRGSSPGSTGQTPSQADRSGDRTGGGRWNRGGGTDRGGDARGERGYRDRAERSVRDRGYRNPQYYRSEGDFYFFLALDSRSRRCLFKIERFSGRIISIEIYGGGGWLDRYDIERRLYRYGCTQIYDIDLYADRYRAHCRNQYGDLLELQLDAYTGDILTVAIVGRERSY